MGKRGGASESSAPKKKAAAKAKSAEEKLDGSLEMHPTIALLKECQAALSKPLKAGSETLAVFCTHAGP